MNNKFQAVKERIEVTEGYRFDDPAHVHTLNGKPLMGTTTLIKEVMPPMLSWYGSGLACKALGWYDRKEGRSNYQPDEVGMPRLIESLAEVQKMTPAEYLNLLDIAYKAHDVYKREKGDWGTQTHAAIESAVRIAIKTNHGYLENTPYKNEAVERFATWGRGKKFIHSEVNVYSEKLWLGGIIDLIYQENDGYYMADVKTSKAVYPSQFIQEGLYDAQQRENGFFDAQGRKVGEPMEILGYTVVNIPVKGKIKYPTYRGTQQLREFAPNLVQLYKTIKELENII